MRREDGICLGCLGIVFVLVSLFPTGAVRPAFAGDIVPPGIIHQPIKEAVEWQLIDVEAVITDNVGVKEAILYCRMAGGEFYLAVPMRSIQSTYFEMIPPELVTSVGVDYYIEVKDGVGNRSTVPAVDPVNVPYHIEVLAEAESSFPSLRILNPEPNSNVETGDQVVAISFFDHEGDIDLRSIRFLVDNRNITQDSKISGSLLTYLPPRPLARGTHRVSFEIRDQAGHKAGPVRWEFTVLGAKPRVFRMSGVVNIGLKYDKPSRPRQNVPLWDNQIRLQAAGGLSWLRLNGLIYLTSLESGFLTSEKLPRRQPVNRFSLNVQSRWFDITVGDSYPVLSDLSLKGILVRGVNLKLNLFGLKLGFIQGLTRRVIDSKTEKTQEDTVAAWLGPTTYITMAGETVVLQTTDVVAQDSSTVAHFGQQIGTFERRVTAAQVGLYLGNVFDFGVNLLEVGDDTTAIDVVPRFRSSYSPKKNFVGTLQATLRLNRRRTVLSAEVGETIITDNVFSELADTTLTEDIPDFVTSRLKINASTKTTLNTVDLSKNITPRLYRLKFVTPISVAHLRGEYYRIPPNYTSLGNPQQQTDVQGYLFNTRWRLFRNQLMASVGFDSYHDNLDLSMPFTTTTATVSSNLSFIPSAAVFGRFRDYSPSLDLGLRLYERENDSAGDTTKVDNITKTLTLGLGGKLRIGGISTDMNLSLMRMGFTDNNRVIPMPGFDTNALMLSIRSRFDRKFTLSASLGATSNKEKGDGVTTRVKIRNLRGVYALLPERLNTYGKLSLVSCSNNIPRTSPKKVDNSQLSFSLGAEFDWKTTVSLSGEFGLVNFADRVDSANDYIEPIVEFFYKRTF
ncbi:MAG: hypothetical protein KAV99_00265 [Candidatus Latescibacteria bacterium]|nr:hypothetical protein [Candidatus Latescibacterota bacterium]